MNAVNRLQCNVPADWRDDFSRCLYEWQGLESAGLALIAAYFGARYLKRQIKQASEHRQDEISRRHNAARLALPLALASISELLQEAADEIAGEIEQFEDEGYETAIDAVLGGKHDRKRFDRVSLPDGILQSFEKFVESLTLAQDIRHVGELISSLQIFLSRYNEFDLKGIAPRIGLEGLLLDAATIKLLNDEIYNYARFVDEGPFGIVGTGSVAEAWDKIHGKAQGLVFGRRSPDLFFAALKKDVGRSKQQGISPWIEKFEL